MPDTPTSCPHCGQHPTGPFPRPTQQFCCRRAWQAQKRETFRERFGGPHPDDLPAKTIEALIAYYAARAKRCHLTMADAWTQIANPLADAADPTPPRLKRGP